MRAGPPFFSIVIPVYNRAAYLLSAVESALDQDFGNFEVLVVDDGSTDGGPDMAAALNNARLRVERLPRAGAPAARNAGIRLARGDFLVWLDSDDMLEPGTLEAYAGTIARYPDAEVLYGRIHLAGEDLKPVGTIEFEDWRARNRELLSTLLFRCPLPHPGSAVARRCYDRVGGYNESFRRAHDYEFWTRLALRAVFKYAPRPVCRWRWHKSNMSAGSVEIDTSFELEIVRSMVRTHPLRRLLPELVSDPEGQGSLAAARLARRLSDLGDPGLAEEIEIRAGEFINALKAVSGRRAGGAA